MERRQFIAQSSALLLAPVITSMTIMKGNTVRLWRHATLYIEIGGQKILVDPMLSAKDAMDPVRNASNEVRIPMVDLPISDAEVKKGIAGADAIIVTHTHRDHWDAIAHDKIPKDKTLLIQPSDQEAIAKLGFTKAIAIHDELEWNGLKIIRTGGQHGTGEIGKRMGVVSGFIISYDQSKLYIAGDTVWCPEVENAIRKHQPNTIVLNAGEARFKEGDPITMGFGDIQKVIAAAPKANIIAVHMDTINHCMLRRADLKKMLVTRLEKKVAVPDDGDTISI